MLFSRNNSQRIIFNRLQKMNQMCVCNENEKVWDTINKIVNQGNQETAFYVCDVNDIIQKNKVWNTVMDRIEPHYAVKCNDHPIVLKVLAALGVGFDCASKLEIEKVLNLGVNPSRIIYAHTTKPSSHISYAAAAKVEYVTFDNELELYKIKNLHTDAKAIIRIKYDAKAATFLLGSKFGCDPDTEALDLLRAAKSVGINVVGVSFHVGTGCQDPVAFNGAIEAAHKVFKIASAVGYDFKLLDIGGGYPGHQDCTINAYAEVINAAIEKYFPDKSVRIVSEPGTYFVDSAFSLACCIHSSRKLSHVDSDTGKSSEQYVYYINDSVFGNFRDVIACNITRIPEPLKQYPKSKKCLSTIRGETNYEVDQIINDILLPEMQLGDWLIFSNMGAYTIAISSKSFESPQVYSIITENNWILLRDKHPVLEEDFARKNVI